MKTPAPVLNGTYAVNVPYGTAGIANLFNGMTHGHYGWPAGSRVRAYPRSWWQEAIGAHGRCTFVVDGILFTPPYDVASTRQHEWIVETLEALAVLVAAEDGYMPGGCPDVGCRADRLCGGCTDAFTWLARM